MFELADIDVEHGAAQVVAGQRVSQGVLVDDLAPSNVDEDAVWLHRGKTVFVEQAVRFRRPLATDGNDIAVRQETIKVVGAGDFGEPRGQGLIRDRVAAGANDPHAEGGAEAADLYADPAGADDAGGLAVQHKRPIHPRTKCARVPINGGTVEALGKVQDTSHRVFRDRLRIGRSARGRYGHVAAPQIAAEQVARTRGALVKPFQAGCAGTQVERERPTAKDDIGIREKAVALLAGSPASGVWCEVSFHGKGGPGFAILAIEPASGIGQLNRRIDGLDLRSVFSAEAHEGKDLNSSLPCRAVSGPRS